MHLGPGRPAVLNACDPATPLLELAMPDDVVRVHDAGPLRGERLRPPALAGRAIELSPRGTRVVVEPGELVVPLVGYVFGKTAIAAACAARAAGVEPDAVRRGLAASHSHSTQVTSRSHLTQRSGAW